MSTIEDFLKEEKARIDYGDKWMVWDKEKSTWVVYQHKYHGRTKEIYRSFEVVLSLSKLREE